MRSPCVALALLLIFLSHASAQTVKWSAFTWKLRDDTGGPGPNRFSAKNVTVDKDGALHLSIVKQDDKWTCAELYTEETFGFGTYEFKTKSRVDNLDRNVVLGLFSYPTEKVGPDGTNELDIEFARWGKQKNKNGNFTAWPNAIKHDNAHSEFEFKLKDGDATTHRYTWKAESISFESLIVQSDKTEKSISKWNTPASFATLVAKKPMPLHINLWLFKGKAPTDGNPVEIVLDSFQFTKQRISTAEN